MIIHGIYLLFLPIFFVSTRFPITISFTASNALVDENGNLLDTEEVQKLKRIDKEQEIKINDTNCMIIKDGQADMIEADCPDQICVDHKTISKNKETIVCLPNKVIVEIVGGEDVEMDTVAN